MSQPSLMTDVEMNATFEFLIKKREWSSLLVSSPVNWFREISPVTSMMTNVEEQIDANTVLKNVRQRP